MDEGIKSKFEGLVEPSTEKQAKMSAAAETADEEDEHNVELSLFLNPLIMDKIIKYLPLRCLPTLRSTCKLWNNLMVVEYRDRKSNFDPTFVNINKESMEHAVDILNKASELPFAAFSFDDILINTSRVQKVLDKIGKVMTHLKLNLSKYSLPIETFRTLLFNQCPVLHSLEIRDHAISDVPKFWKCKLQTPGNEEVVQTLPHLKNLSLGFWCGTKFIQVYPTSSFSLISDLFNAAVNLETIKLNDFRPYGLALNGVVLDILLTQKQSGNLHKIQKIEFDERISVKNLEDLVELSSRKSAGNRLGLKELDLRHFLSDVCFIDPQGVRLMSQFLRLQASSLQKLTASLGDDKYGKKYKVSLPIMPSLKSLRLQMDYSLPPVPANANGNNGDLNAANDNGPLLPNVRFDSLLTNFPNLQALEIMSMDWMKHGSNLDDEGENVEARATYYKAKRTAFMAQLGTHHGITKFNVTLDTKDSSYLVVYASLFPNVKSLTVFFSNRFYHKVWSVWPELELLTITIRLLFYPKETEIDSSITGIPMQSLKLLKSASSPSVNNPNGGEGKRDSKKRKMELDWNEYKTQPGITDLHQLHTFNLYYVVAVGGISAAQYVTDLSAKYGFIPTANNSKLRRIYIQRYSNFSPEVVTAVDASLGLHGDFVPIDEGLKRQEQEKSKWGYDCCR